MKPVLASLITAGITAASLTAVMPTAEADTFECVFGLKLTHITVAASQNFKATSDCQGVFATGTVTRTDDVRGRFYKDGAWQVSSLGWTRIAKGDDGAIDMVVGNTITGRDIKGQAKTTVQQVGYAY